MDLVLNAMTITYNLTEKGRLVLWSQGSANWQSILSEDDMATRTVTYTPSDYLLYSTGGGGTNYTDNNNGVFYIPLHTGNNYQTATVTLTYEVRRYTGPSTYETYRTASPSAVLTLSDYASYEAGKQLIMDFTINEIHAGLQTTAAITDWTDQTVGSFDAQ